MDASKIAQLAQLLRHSGDKVLNDRYKLTLSVELLQSLNDSFRLIVNDSDELSMAGGNGSIHGPADASHFQVVSKYHNAKTAEMRDLQLIYDFVQKTRILCVTNFTKAEEQQQKQQQSNRSHNTSITSTTSSSSSNSSSTTDCSTVDISRFRNLRRLEICKLHVSRVRGIQKMRAHLQELRCVHSIDSVEEIISHCGGDRCNGFMWNELHTVDFSYNRLRTVDGSLEFVTSLQFLNLSHNQIVSVDAVKWLKNLKYLNLCFNRLAFVPTLHVEAPRRLKVLILSNNHIEKVAGLPRLDALCELDLSDNYLLDHEALSPLRTLIALQVLNVSGNPLACHPKHRQATAKYLHKNTASGKFSLDNELLSKHEKSLTGQHQFMPRPMPYFPFPGRSSSTSINSTPRPTATENSPASSVGSLRSIRMDDSISSRSISTQSSTTTPHHAAEILHRKIRPKTARIAEYPPGAEPPEHRLSALPPALRLDTEHLETKRQIEEMCQKGGDSWLQSHGAKLGDVVAPAPCADILGSPVIGAGVLDRVMQTSTPLVEKRPLDVSETSAYKTALDTSVLADTTASPITGADANATDGEHAHATPEPEPAESAAAREEIFFDDPPPSDPEENEDVYIVTLQPSLTDMLLVVSKTSIREKDALTGATVTKWSMSTLESCDRTRTDVLRLNFDTANRGRRERIYRVETGLCQVLEQHLRGILAERPLSEMNQVVYRCMKCEVCFSRERQAKMTSKRAAVPQCPNCRSEFLVEMSESPRTQQLQQPQQPQPTAVVMPEQPQPTPEAELLQGSESQSSIAPNPSTETAACAMVSDPNHMPKPSSRSAQSLNESSSCSRISKASSSFDSTRSMDGSCGPAGRCRRAADFAAEQRPSADESDVEILSNPSQSSIEVLDRNCAESNGRKHSEEYAYHPSMELSLDSVAEQINRLSVTDTLLTASAQQQHQQTSTRDLLQLVNAEPSADGNEAVAVAVDSPTTAVAATAATSARLQVQHLTESSSSGSVTDSICTTYDQNQRTITNSNASSIIIGNEALQQRVGSPERSPTATPSSGLITSMFGGLFQSTNNLMSRKSNGQSGGADQTDPFKFSYVDFEAVDHRLKAYLYQTVFEDDNEQLKWLVRGQVQLERPVGKWRYGTAIFVMSTTKFYVLQCVGAERDNVSKWVRRQLAGTIDRLQVVQVLPWKIGLSIEIKGIGVVQLLLQDILRTDRLLLFLDKNPLPNTCVLNYQPAEMLGHQLLLTADNKPLKMLAILNECSCAFFDATPANDIQQPDDSKSAANATTTTTTTVAAQKLLGLIVTETHLYLLEPAHRWLLPETDAAADVGAAEVAEAAVEVLVPLAVLQQQSIDNLVAAERHDDRTVRFVYLEEVQNRQEEWTCTFETAENAISTVDAVGQSWERLFGVPLTLSN